MEFLALIPEMLASAIRLSIPLIFYVKGAKSVPAVAISLIVMLDAVINPLWPMLFVGEHPENSAYIGGAIIIGSVSLSILGGRWMTRGTT